MEPPLGFEVRAVGLEPGGHRIYNESEWGDAVVVVASGEIELECLRGTTRGFKCGDVLWLTGLPLRALRNRGPEPVLLLAVSRRYATTCSDS
jgi:quercetin dioxygenase-like cupin family protein